MSCYPSGIVYTEAAQGKWEGKAGSHAPKVSVEEGKLTIKTEHPMTEPHFIVRHTLVTEAGEVIGEKTFTAGDEEAASVFELPSGVEGKLFATSFCNLHDLWLTEVSI
ncbi:MAG: desulfoferrodoxin family protein [Thermodesulfobacteriota bacterium]